MKSVSLCLLAGLLMSVWTHSGMAEEIVIQFIYKNSSKVEI